MARFAMEANEAPVVGERQVSLVFGIASLRRDQEAADGIEVFALVFSATALGIGCESAKAFFEDNYITIGFAGAGSAQKIGQISCLENSTGSDCGVIVELEAAGLLPAVEAMSPYPIDFEGETEPFATLRVSFSMRADDGLDGGELVDNLLNGPPRAICRVELEDFSKRRPA